MAKKYTLDIELECINIPTQGPPGLNELRLGVQVGQAVEQDMPCPAEQIVLRFPVQFEIDPGEGVLRFSGQAVHGPRGGKFLYLCWGEWVDGKWHGNRRAKLPLGPVELGMVEAALLAGRPLRARVNMTDSRDQPVAASLKPGAYEWGI